MLSGLSIARMHQTCHFRKRATSAPAEGPACGLDLARHCEFPLRALQAQKWLVYGSGTFGAGVSRAAVAFDKLGSGKAATSRGSPREVRRRTVTFQKQQSPSDYYHRYQVLIIIDVVRRIETPLKAAHPERPTITFAWSPERPPGILLLLLLLLLLRLLLLRLLILLIIAI